MCLCVLDGELFHILLFPCGHAIHRVCGSSDACQICVENLVLGSIHPLKESNKLSVISENVFTSTHYTDPNTQIETSNVQDVHHNDSFCDVESIKIDHYGLWAQNLSHHPFI